MLLNKRSIPTNTYTKTQPWTQRNPSFGKTHPSQSHKSANPFPNYMQGNHNSFGQRTLPTRNTGLPLVQSKRITLPEIEEKRAKGFCFACDEKYECGHQCGKRRQIVVMELEDDDTVNEVGEPIPIVNTPEIELEEEVIQISTEKELVIENKTEEDLAENFANDTVKNEVRSDHIELIEEGKGVAIGECGLDYDRLHFCPPDILKKHFELAYAIKLPMFIHMRTAAEDLCYMLLLNKHIKNRNAGIKFMKFTWPSKKSCLWFECPELQPPPPEPPPPQLVAKISGNVFSISILEDKDVFQREVSVISQKDRNKR